MYSDEFFNLISIFHQFGIDTFFLSFILACYNVNAAEEAKQNIKQKHQTNFIGKKNHANGTDTLFDFILGIFCFFFFKFFCILFIDWWSKYPNFVSFNHHIFCPWISIRAQDIFQLNFSFFFMLFLFATLKIGY